jgi:hypothetical protein
MSARKSLVPLLLLLLASAPVRSLPPSTHSFTHSLPHSSTKYLTSQSCFPPTPLTPPLTHSLTHPYTHPPLPPSPTPPTPPLTPSLPHPYTHTILNRVISFRWKPTKRSWQFPLDPSKQSLISAPPPALKLFDLLLWPCHSPLFTITHNTLYPPHNPRTVLAYPDLPRLREAIHVCQLTKLEKGQKRSLVLAGEDSGAFCTTLHHTTTLHHSSTLLYTMLCYTLL